MKIVALAGGVAGAKLEHGLAQNAICHCLETTVMDDEQRMRPEQFARNFGATEFLRFGCAYMTLLMVGLALGMAFHNAGIIIIFFVVSHGILWFAPYWQPAYTIVHKMMGNRELPSILPILPKSQRKWWHYIPIAIKVIILVAILRLGVQLLFQ